MIKKAKFKVELPEKDVEDLRFLLTKIRLSEEENPLKEMERLKQLRQHLSVKLRTASPEVKALFYYELAYTYEDLQHRAYKEFQGPRPSDDIETCREKADCLLEAKEALLDLEGGPYSHLNVHILNYIGILEAMQDKAWMARMAFEASMKALSHCAGETKDFRSVIEANLRTLNERPRSPVYNRLSSNFKIK